MTEADVLAQIEELEQGFVDACRQLRLVLQAKRDADLRRDARMALLEEVVQRLTTPVAREPERAPAPVPGAHLWPIAVRVDVPEDRATVETHARRGLGKARRASLLTFLANQGRPVPREALVTHPAYDGQAPSALANDLALLANERAIYSTPAGWCLASPHASEATA